MQASLQFIQISYRGIGFTTNETKTRARNKEMCVDRRRICQLSGRVVEHFLGRV